MAELKLAQAQAIVAAALRHAREKRLAPMAVLVLDARGVPKAFAAEDDTSLRRFEIAQGKAHGALAMGLGSRELAKRAAERPQFIAAVTHAVGGMLIPVPGGVLIRDGESRVIGAVGASGDTSDNDEAAVLAGIAAAGLIGDSG